MTNRGFFLFLALLATASYAIVANWDQISAVLHIGQLAQDEALVLAKNEHSMEHQRNNSEVIADVLNDPHSEVVAHGWTAEQRSETVFLVQFKYTSDDEAMAFSFEVDVATERVLRIEGDEDLEKKYFGSPPK